MSLLKRKQEKEQKAAEAATRLAKKKREQELSIHPLVKGGCDRDVRDAYFQGLIFAAIADDDKVDKNERGVLVDIGASLEIPSAEVEDGIAGVTALTDDGKFSLIEECAKSIKENDTAVKLFYAQFIQLWTLHEYEKKELDEYLHQFAEWTGVTLPEAKKLAIKKVVECDDGLNAYLASLADWMGEDALKYFVVGKYGDVSDFLLKEHRRRKAMKAKKIRDEEVRIEKVRKNFATVIERMSEEHKYASALRRGWDVCLKENLLPFAKGDIDWVAECRSRLRALMNIKVGKAIFSAGCRIRRRKLVWELMCMQFVYGKDVYASEINKMLRAAAEQSDDEFRQRIEKFISDTFADDVLLKCVD